jgi:hypothetical protein
MEIRSMECEVAKKAIKVGAIRAIEAILFILTFISDDIVENTSLILSVSGFLLILSCKRIVVEAIAVDIVRIDFINILMISDLEVSAPC